MRRVRDRVRLLRSEADKGVSMLLVIGVVLLFGSLGAVVTSVTVSGMQKASHESYYNQALQNADSGLQAGLTLYAANATSTAYDTTQTYSGTGSERAWAKAIADTMTPFTVPNGQYVFFRVSGSSTIYGVGYSPTQSCTLSTSKCAYGAYRVVKGNYIFTPVASVNAIQADGDLSFSSNVNTTGTNGSVYAGGNVTQNSNPGSINGSMSSGGTTCSGCTSGVSDTAHSGANNPNGDSALPTIRPRDWYPKSQYDFCPDGSVRPGPSYPNPTSSTPANTSGTPCNYSLPNLLSGGTFRGWKAGGLDGYGNELWTDSNATAPTYNGVYYAYDGGFKETGNQASGTTWNTMLIAEKSSTSDCTKGWGGDITFTGTTVDMAYLGNNYPIMVAGRNLTFTGGGNGAGGPDAQGLLLANGWFDITNKTSIYGAVASNNAGRSCGDTAASKATNTLNVTYNGGGVASPASTPTVSLWSEPY